MKSLTLLSAIVAALVVSAPFDRPVAASERFPEKPVILVVPAPRGGGTDVFARELARIVEDDLQQTVIVDNRPRAGGTEGVARVVTAPADGYILGFVWNSPLTARPMTETLSYTVTGFRPVMSIGYSSYVLCVAPEFPADDAESLLAALAAKPDFYTIANDGPGGTLHLAVTRILAKKGISARSVSFTGSTDAARSFMAGEVAIYGGSLSAILAHVREGRAKCLLSTSAADNPVVPQAQGLARVGLAEAETVLWWGLIAPAATPAPIVRRLEAAFLRAAGTARFRALMERQGATHRLRGEAETVTLIRTEAEALRAAAEAAGLRRMTPAIASGPRP